MPLYPISVPVILQRDRGKRRQQELFTGIQTTKYNHTSILKEAHKSKD
jgi:hypothetical protein